MATIRTQTQETTLQLHLKSHKPSKKVEIEKVFTCIEMQELSEEEKRGIAEARELLSSYGDFNHLDEKALDDISLILTGLLCDVVEPLGDKALEKTMEDLIQGYLPQDALLEDYKDNHLAISQSLLGGIAKVERVINAARDQLYVAADAMEESVQSAFSKGKQALIEQDQKRQGRILESRAEIEGLTERVSQLFGQVEEVARGLGQVQTGINASRQLRLDHVKNSLNLMSTDK